MRTGRTDAAESVFRGRAEVVQDLVELVDVAAKALNVDIKVYGKNTYSRPLKMGFPASNSARMQPTDQTSMAGPYLKTSETAEVAMYHRRT